MDLAVNVPLALAVLPGSVGEPLLVVVLTAILPAPLPSLVDLPTNVPTALVLLLGTACASRRAAASISRPAGSRVA